MLILIIAVVGCSRGTKNQRNNIQCRGEVEKILKIREKTYQEMAHKNEKVGPKFEREKMNRYVFRDGKLIIISYKLFKDKEQLFYVAYEIEGEKVYYKRDINPKDCIKEHKPDCRDIRKR